MEQDDMVVYRGINQRTAGGGMLVLKDKEELSPVPSQQLINHSPDGFAWGYGGSGPAQLALALLLDATGSDAIALAHYQDFKWQIVAILPDRWHLTKEGILGWLRLKRGVKV